MSTQGTLPAPPLDVPDQAGWCRPLSTRRFRPAQSCALDHPNPARSMVPAHSQLLVVVDKREYLTGFHKRKVERKKAAIEEIKQRLKQEQKKLREERHQEYLKMLAEREEALEEADELERLVTAKTESVQYDHPNHTVTVTTISDLDLSGARLLGLPLPEQGDLDGSQEEVSCMEKPTKALPRKSKDPLLSQRISSLTATLHAHSRKKVKRKHPRRAQDSTKKPPSATRTSKTQRRRRMTGKARHSGE
ncbi:nucleolar protein 12 isoform X1 [Cricetulus griseus]|uniref:Nucleolar protein 12 n=1 Tax=Cricetulus griseus TaxID=10029 RepID=A0A9J7JHB1_CRIGR|nr:nucleolar protein 12 isoform X1 [Cricetulus griseus]XP_027259773.1 nucleolar protein 12 isoform X1 [Cricetulus griseus]